jgi:hypothetical protein
MRKTILGRGTPCAESLDSKNMVNVTRAFVIHRSPQKISSLLKPNNIRKEIPIKKLSLLFPIY